MILLLKLTTIAEEHFMSYGIIVKTFHAFRIDG